MLRSQNVKRFAAFSTVITGVFGALFLGVTGTAQAAPRDCSDVPYQATMAAAAGAATGAGIGSGIGGPPGTAMGGMIGGTIGLFGGVVGGCTKIVKGTAVLDPASADALRREQSKKAAEAGSKGAGKAASAGRVAK